MGELNIYQRINAVMKEVKYVQKNQKITGGGANYSAVTHDQVVAVIRESLVNNGIVIEPKQVAGEFVIKRDLSATPAIKMGLYSGTYDISFVNIDKPDDRSTISVDAHASDNGDKAPGKAVTYAVKTAVLKMFFLETGENEESRAEDFAIMSRRANLTFADLTKYIQESGYTQDQVAQAFGCEFANIDIRQAFDCVTSWKRQQ